MTEAREMIIDGTATISNEVTPLPPRTLAEIRADLGYDQPATTRENARQEWANVCLQVAQRIPALAAELKARGVDDTWINPQNDDWFEWRSSPGQGFHTSNSLLKGFAEDYPHAYLADQTLIPDPKITQGSSVAGERLTKAKELARQVKSGFVDTASDAFRLEDPIQKSAGNLFGLRKQTHELKQALQSANTWINAERPPLIITRK
ncbi:MAG: hypothetical protein AAB874_01760 [Patescibacteria group bacterium]